MRSTVTSDSTHTPHVLELFAAFLLIGATSFGGGVIAHLRSSLVVKHRWTDDKTFVEMLTISQTLPGLKAVNLAMLLGDRLRGTLGAVIALIGICLPGAALMYGVGVMYHVERDRRLLVAALEGVAPAAVGLILATTVGLGRKSFVRVDDLVFIVLTVVCINRLHVPVPRVLVGVGLLAAVWYGFFARGEGEQGGPPE
jgi:chromate transporter